MRIVGRSTIGDSKHVIGYEKSKGQTRLRIDGEEQSGFAIATKLLPVIEITPNSHEIIERGPGQRRRFLDWGVFHVEHPYGECWRRHMRALRQRNAALKSRQHETEKGWRGVLVKEAESVDQYRKIFFDKFRPLATDRLAAMVPELSVELTYYPGWDRAKGLMSVLESDQQRDHKTGITHHGPQRADLRLTVGGVALQQSASRGQQKVCVMALKLAMADVLVSETKNRAILLVDDLASELDRERRAAVLIALSELNAQSFITTIEASQIHLRSEQQSKVFHVEHGIIRSID
jgi:DNA replication and repair protein RecF